MEASSTISINRIALTESTYTIDFSTNTEFVSDDLEDVHNELMIAEAVEWKPSFIMAQQHCIISMHHQPASYTVGPTSIIAQQHFTAQYPTKFYCRNEPFDIQQLTLKLGTNFTFNNDNQECPILTFAANTQFNNWIVVGMALELSDCDGGAEAVISIKLKRKVTRVVIGVFGPVLCLVLIGLMTHFMESKDDTLNALITLLLSIIAIQWIYGSLYVSFVQVVIFGGFSYLTLLWLLNVVDIVFELESDLFAVEIIVLVATVVLFIIFGCYIAHTEKKKLNLLPSHHIANENAKSYHITNQHKVRGGYINTWCNR